MWHLDFLEFLVYGLDLAEHGHEVVEARERGFPLLQPRQQLLPLDTDVVVPGNTETHREHDVKHWSLANDCI